MGVQIEWLQLFILLVLLVFSVKPLGIYIARVYQGDAIFGVSRIIYPIELILYRLCRVEPNKTMTWVEYALAMLTFSVIGIIVAYVLQRLQQYLPLNPQHFPNLSPLLAINNAISYTTNTNWQAYSGEVSISYFTQMVVFTVQNFLSAATGLAVLIALIRSFAAREALGIGNFWVDVIRGVLYIFLPLSIIFAGFLISQGVIQNLKPYLNIQVLESLSNSTTAQVKQIIAMGPVASQAAIKLLGTNGGGFFNVNAAHPFENPTPITNFISLLIIMMIPAALCYTFGCMVQDKKQGWAILIVMLILFIPSVCYLTLTEEINWSPSTETIASKLGATLYPSGNLEGKETRIGISGSTFWAAITTATSNGSINSNLNSYKSFSMIAPLWLMHLGEIVFGGIGSGLYGMCLFILLAIFIGGLMVGRTPEYLGKKIEPYEMKMVAFAVLLMPLIVLVATAFSLMLPEFKHELAASGTHGFTQALYAFTSLGNNNGSSLAGLNINTPFFYSISSIIMLLSRYWVAICVLAIAGKLAQKKIAPINAGTLLTCSPMFLVLLIGLIIILGSLSFLPSLALGPIEEGLVLWEQYGR